MATITIKNVEPDITESLKVGGVTVRGNQYLKAASILDQAGIIDHLITMYDNGIHKQSSLLDMLEKAVKIGRIISGDNVHLTNNSEPVAADQGATEPEAASAPKFGA